PWTSTCGPAAACPPPGRPPPARPDDPRPRKERPRDAETSRGRSSGRRQGFGSGAGLLLLLLLALFVLLLRGVRGSGGAGLARVVGLAQRALLHPLVPRPDPEAPAVVDLHVAAAVLDVHRVAGQRLVVEPAGVGDRHVHAAVAGVGLAEHPVPGRRVQELPAVGDPHRVLHELLVVAGVAGLDAQGVVAHPVVGVLLHGEVHAAAGAELVLGVLPQADREVLDLLPDALQRHAGGGAVHLRYLGPAGL